MKTSTWNLPPRLIADLPELPVLATLYAALIHAERALCAARPDLFAHFLDEQKAADRPPADYHIAQSVIQTGTTLRHLLQAYRERRLDDHDDRYVPF